MNKLISSVIILVTIFPTITQAQSFAPTINNLHPEDYRAYCSDVIGQHSTPQGVFTTVVGKNCDAVTNGATQREINYQQQQTQRMGIESRERIAKRDIEARTKLQLFHSVTSPW